MSNILKRIHDHLSHNIMWPIDLIWRKMSPIIPSDEIYIKVRHYILNRRWPDLKNPKRFNDKLMWLKLNDKHEEYSLLVDKATSKEYVKKICPDCGIIKTIGIWNNFDEIDFDQLPNQFVLKTTHDSGSVVLVKDKATMDISEARRKLNKSLKHNYFWNGREYPYKNLKHRIIAEEFMVDESGVDLKDYKFFCFDGEPKFLFVAGERPYNTKFNFYDIDFNLLPFKNVHPNFSDKISKPKSFDLMIKIAKELSKGMRHVRVDLYEINGKPYFGELTFFHNSGNEPFDPDIWDYKLGEYIKLPI